MPAKRELSMRQLRHLLRLHHDGVSAREIGRRLGVARSTIQDNLKRAAAAGLAWPLADDVTDEALETRLFGRAGVAQGQRRRAEPDWAALARELKRPGITMTILWEEYREVHPEGYGYQPLLRPASWIRTAADHGDAPAPRRRGDGVRRLFGQADRDRRSDDRRNPRGGDFRRRARRLEPTYAEATWTQTLPDWTGAHVRMFRFFGGAPKLLIPDNLKSGVNKVSFYDPEINRTYGAMAAHYSVGILPARARRPRDKAKVEAGVRFAQTYILGRLRHLTFFSLAECNAAIALVMQRMNECPMRNLGLSRRELFEIIERDALIALPADDWEFAEWRRARVNLDYHIEVHDFRADPRRGRRADHRANRRDLPSRPTRRRPSAPHHGPQARHGPIASAAGPARSGRTPKA